MSEKTERLKAGEHYGAVFHKHRTTSAVISESVYGCTMCLPEHAHELGFFTLILDGCYSEIINRRNVSYSPQTVLWRQAELSHKDKIEAESSRFFFVEIERDFAARLERCERVPDHLAERSGPLAMLAGRLRSEVIAGDRSSPLIIEGLTLELLGTMVRQGYRSDTRPPKWLDRVIERLNDDLNETVTNEELACEAGVHPVHLAAAFRRHYNSTIGDYVQRLRVERAAALLCDRSRTLTEIALDCGFADQSHFTRVFKRRMGSTPGAYRAHLAD